MAHSPTDSRPERTGWRDEKISARHRMWGFNCPAVDLDFLMVEYNLGKPVGLVEYKHEGAAMPSILHPTYRAITELANLASLPFIIAFYNNIEWWFKVTPVNDRAKTLFAEQSEFTEREFVSTLYDLRNLVVEIEVLQRLNDTKPGETSWVNETNTVNKFWRHCMHDRNLTQREVLQALNVASIDAFSGTKQDAVNKLNKLSKG